MKIAVAGKGGVGKSTISAELIRYYAQNNYRVYAVDADPDLSLGELLGFSEKDIESLQPVSEMLEEISARSGGKGAFYSLNPEVDEILDHYVLEDGNIKFLKMGGLKRGGSSCYCRENSVLRSVVSNLLLDKKEVVVLDMGAGIEHLTRGTSEGVDVMLIVTEPTKVSIQSANTIAKLATELGIENIRFIGNKVRTEADQVYLQQQFGTNLALVIEYEEEILRGARGEDVTANKLKRAVAGLGELLRRRVVQGS